MQHAKDQLLRTQKRPEITDTLKNKNKKKKLQNNPAIVILFVRNMFADCETPHQNVYSCHLWKRELQVIFIFF